jgi:hypothetical protein
MCPWSTSGLACIDGRKSIHPNWEANYDLNDTAMAQYWMGIQ